MRLIECIHAIALKEVTGDADIEITGIEINSKNVKQGDLFVALRGHNVDGHQFISQAIHRGAVAVLAEDAVDVGVPLVTVPDTSRALAIVASIFYGHPTKELSLIGVTGTNGKTTTTHMIDTILRDAGNRTGLIGTMQMKIDSKEYAVSNTTPDSLQLQRSFRKMREVDCKYAVIEVSSHALHMGRTLGSYFRTAVFTNLTQDHLDYHQTMENYRAAKGLLFGQLSFSSYAVINADDASSAYFSKGTAAQVITYGIRQKADVWADNIRVSAKGTLFTLHTFSGVTDVRLVFIGEFNIYNVLAAVAVSLLEGVPLLSIKKSLEEMQGVHGRFETIEAGQPYTVIIDYAHTPDSLENVLTTIRQFAQGKVICVVGCGGDRDSSKRPIMAQIAAKYSDLAIFTTDNPRTEDPNMILLEMVEGVNDLSSNYVCSMDRKEAIRYAIEHAEEHDVVLIAGKGHETYQEMNGIRYAFDDREIARDIITGLDGDKNAAKL